MKLRKFNERAFDVIEDNAAYWCGFLFADGSIRKDAPVLCLKLSERDIDQIKAFREFMQSTNGIGRETHIKGGTKCYSVRLSLHSKHLCKRLKQLGLEHNRIPCEELTTNRNFWRGTIDGDGCIQIKPHNRLILVGSRLFLEKWITYIRRLYPNTVAKVRRDGYRSIHIVQLYGDCCRTVIKELYSDVDTVLMRKYYKAQEIINAQTRNIETGV